MFRWLGLAAAAAVSGICLCRAQSPDVNVRLDVSFNYQFKGSDDDRVAFYDPLGRHSTVTLEFTIEPGFDMVVSQRFQPIAHDPDNSAFDEYYIQDRGYWRFGKQYIPFGADTVLHESGYAGLIRLSVGERAFPAYFGYIDTGKLKQQGFFGRVGGKFGISAVFGKHLAINGNSLPLVRRPKEAPGVGRGYQRAIGIDARVTVAPGIVLVLDHVSLRRAETAKDELMDISDVHFRWSPKKGGFALIGVTHEWKSTQTFIRATGQLALYDGLYLEPFIRIRNGNLVEASLTLRVKP